LPPPPFVARRAPSVGKEPWESAPEHGVYSNQSEVATALMGHAAGDIVSFMGNDYQIESIGKWYE